jgi:YD repeat-containing protein
MTFEYGANGRVSRIVDEAGRAQSYTYDSASGRIASVTDAAGKTASFSYVGDSEIAPDPACGSAMQTFGQRLKTLTYAGRPNPTVNHYGSSRRVLRQIGFDGREMQFTYRVQGACITHVNSPGAKCTGTSCPTEDSWENFQAGWRFHGGRVVRTTVTEPDGTRHSYDFDAAGAMVAATDAAGQPVSWKLDTASRVTQTTDALGRQWSYTYDSAGNPLVIRDALGRVIETAYDPLLQEPTEVKRYLGATPVPTQYQYHPVLGKVSRITDPLGHSTDFAYTPQGQLESLTDALGHVTRFEYNGAGDLVALIDPLGNRSAIHTDAVGRPTRFIDPLGFATTAQHNGTDDVTEQTDALGGQTTLTYDAAGRLASVIDPLGHTVESYQYDPAGRLVQVTDALNRGTLYEYDSAGRLSQITDRKGQITRYAYDSAGRLASIQYPDRERSFAYDALGRLIQVREGASAQQLGYDVLGRLSTVTDQTPFGESTLLYEYDDLDRVIRRTVEWPGLAPEATQYEYDLASRLTAVLFRGSRTEYSWDAAGRLTVKTLPNGIRQTYDYDDANRLTQIRYLRSDGTLIEAIAYLYDAKGQRLQKTFGVGSAPETPFTAVYDAANRMSEITLYPGSAQAKTYDLAYDDNGNLVSKLNRADPADRTTYTWDPRNRLTAIQGPGLNASFVYDVLGRRIERTVNGETTRYIYDGAQAIGEIRGNQTTALLTGLAIDEMIARYTDSSQRVYLTDALGSVIAQTREDQSVQNFYGYSPYGQAISTTDDEGNDIEYTARENDETGLYYYRARYCVFHACRSADSREAGRVFHFMPVG